MCLPANQINVECQERNFLINMPKTKMQNEDDLRSFTKKLRVEQLAHEVGFGSEIEKVGEELKQSWWRRNKEKYLPST